MTVETLKTRIENSKKTIESKTKTLERHEKRLEKKTEEYKSLEPGSREAYFALCDLEEISDNIESTEKALKKAKENLAKYEIQLNKAQEEEDNLPDVLKKLEVELADEWYKIELQRKEEFNKKYKTYEDARQDGSSYSTFDRYHYTLDSEFKKEAKVDAHNWVLDLQKRVYNKVGEITDWSHVSFCGKALNGWITGTKGETLVETIGAGGYNVQRYHLRVILH